MNHIDLSCESSGVSTTWRRSLPGDHIAFLTKFNRDLPRIPFPVTPVPGKGISVTSGAVNRSKSPIEFKCRFGLADIQIY